MGAPTATALVVASMVGTGAFTTSGLLLRALGSVQAVMLAWFVGGLIALCGALAYGELVAALPHNGGEYALLSRIYHPAVGFVAGWTSLVVGFAAPVAASALAFAAYARRFVPVPLSESMVATVLIVVVTAVHLGRSHVSDRLQNALTALKIALIVLGVAVCAFVVDWQHARTAVPQWGALVASPRFAIGLIYVSFAYSGWNAAAYVAGEVCRPARNLPLSLMLGTTAVMGLYVALNAVILAAAPASTLAGVVEVAQVAAAHLLGLGAALAVSVLVALGLLTTMGALTVTGPRIYEAMGRDYSALALLGRRHPERGPRYATVLQSLLAVVMAQLAAFDALLTYIGFTLAISAALTLAGVFVLRRREPALPRPYRTWGHPISTTLALALTTWMAIYSIWERPWAAVAGLTTCALGLLGYFWAAAKS
ncbi:MAG: APC family permease [Polyangiales bacterium]